jgi:hypothetical protein
MSIFLSLNIVYTYKAWSIRLQRCKIIFFVCWFVMFCEFVVVVVGGDGGGGGGDGGGESITLRG